MSQSPIHGSPRPRRARVSAPSRHVVHPTDPTTGSIRVVPEIADGERAFFVEEFRGVTIVVSLPTITEDGRASLTRTILGFSTGDTRFVLVSADPVEAASLAASLSTTPAIAEPDEDDADAAADLWLAANDHRVLVVSAENTAMAAAHLSATLGASKILLTDPEGGWGHPSPRSFADLRNHRAQLSAELSTRSTPDLLEAAEYALRHGAFSVNLCRAEDIELELFTFDGVGTLVTLKGYLSLTTLRVDDLPAIEELVHRGVATGILKPRSRHQIARMAVGGIGARVVRTGHLAGLVGLEAHAYGTPGAGEVSGLITVSEFSGSGAGGLLIEGLMEHAAERGLEWVFAVTVSDNAAAFFLRRGFVEVSRDNIPAGKWEGYDPERLSRARCFRRDVQAA